MKTCVITHNEIEGFHFWKNAIPPVEFLRFPHRHIFEIECEFEVSHADRDVEIIIQQTEIDDYISSKYGKPANFAEMSCEMIAEEILSIYSNCASCKVLEDGKGGAIVRR